MPNAEDTLLKLLLDRDNGLKVLDDSVPPRLLSCRYIRPGDPSIGTIYSNDDLDRTSTLWILKHPTPLEKEPMLPAPMVVIGPARGGPVTQAIGYGAGTTEIQTVIEIRILTRNVDESQEGWTLDGDRARRRISAGIRSIIQQNSGNPTGSGDFLYMILEGPSSDSDTQDPNPLYRSAFTVTFDWLE
jgi:hypothetical protein